MIPKSELQVLIKPEEIAQKIVAVGKKLDAEYAGKELTLIMVMKGAICLVADLIRQLSIPCSIEFIQGSSYGQKGTKPGALTLFGIEELKLAGKDVLLVDDIYDSGKTLTEIVRRLKEKHPATLKSLVLLNKKVPRETPYLPDYILFDIEDRFVVGYGLDYKEHYRNLPGVYAL